MPRVLAWILILSLWTAPAGAGWGSFSLSDEAELARKFDLVIETRFPPVQDTVVLDYVQGIVDRLLAVMPPQPFPVRVTVVEHPALNAFASPAGRVTVFTGLIAQLESEDELASVLAHELAHVSERHVAQGIERSQYLSVGTLIGMLAGALLGAGGKSESGQALMLGSAAGASSLAFKYSRENERAADQLGFATLVDAGFDPMAMPRAFSRMRRLQWLGGGGNTPSYLSTHPALEERTTALEARAREIAAQRQPQPSATASRFALVQTLVRAAFTPPESAKALFRSQEVRDPCQAALGLGMASARLHQTAEAEAGLTRAMACPQIRPVAAREMGRLLLSLGRVSQAVEFLRAAQQGLPGDVTTGVLLAQAFLDLGDAAQAWPLVQPALERFSHDSDLWQLSGRIEAARGKESAAHLAFARSFAFARRWEKYAWHLQRAKALAQTPAERQAISHLEAEVEELQQLVRQLG